MSEQKDLQEQLLLRAQECRKSVLVITTNGFQMRGVIVGSDRFVIALKGDGRLQISVPPPKHFLVVCSDSKRPCFRKPPDPYRNMWPLCLVFRRPQIDTIFQARFL